tara:strand:- start:2074 stop:2526 length:453 start_codon:yes stop_codon:yes gene_type:complete
MKKILIIMTLIVMPFCMSGQQSKQKNALPLAKFDANVNLPLTAKERAQIIEVYGDSAEKLVFNMPHRLKSIKHILRNRVVIKLISDDKDKKACPKLSEVSLFNESNSEAKVFNPDTFNPLRYDLNFYSREASLFQVDNTNYYIIVKSQYQ